ncbi:MAG TPA: hypothetical protein DCL07_07085, partial [Cryomorphaceae bacterium]|nr:hypothetical protein [Cryomorphaceae bacterium]
SSDLYGSTDRDQYFGSDMIVGGVHYTRPINKRSYMKAGLAASSARITAVNTKLQREVGLQDDETYGWNVTSNDTMLNYTFHEQKINAFLSYNHKIGLRGTLQYGVNADLYMLNYQDSVRQYDGVTGTLPPWRV